MSAQPARGYLGISEVLAELRADFPDVSVSKIRFLETEGLITPARSPSGYRRFCAADLDRLRFILTAQRDQYLPLRVIRDRLARLDERASQAGQAGQAGRPAPVPARRPAGADRQEPGYQGTGEAAGPTALLSRRELVEAAGLSEALLTELETFGLLRRVGRQYGPDALEVARSAAALTSFGVEARHLRAVRAAAERETTMIESLVAPILRQRGPGARELASRTARDCAALVLRLHAALVEGALAEAGLAEPGQAAETGHDQQVGARRQQAHGIEGATA
jgi:DNA-binding transcriptional MerR regulator